MVSSSLPTKISEFDINPIENSTKELLGYYVTSTASINVEDEPSDTTISVKEPIAEIAQYLVKSPAPQIVISIHGYATKRSDAKKRYRKIYNFASHICEPKSSVFLGYCWPAENPAQDDPDPDKESKKEQSTSFGEKLRYAIQSLPTLLIGILSSTVVLAVITTLLILGKPYAPPPLTVFSIISIFSILGSVGLLKLGQALYLLPRLPFAVLFLGLLIGSVTLYSPVPINWLLVNLLILFASSFSIILALVALRLSTYLRDGYRAENYGVLDLVELIRQLDQAVFDTKLLELLNTKSEDIQLPGELEKVREEWQTADNETKLELWRKIPKDSIEKFAIEQAVISKLKKIKLTFIGHSMGCLVVTNTIRILSDVFDTNSINKNPSGEIGRAFWLGRLILVAPDIPVESIMPRRANFLRSSLRRCEEAYLFSNEGDLALRLASTAANYFRFPAKTRISGYRLGNLTIQHSSKSAASPIGSLQQVVISEQDYGIVNLSKPDRPYCYLEIRASDRERQTLNRIRPIASIAKEDMDSIENAPVADLFTYFDCTDYTDYKDSDPTCREGVVSYALKKSALNLWDYFQLTLAYFLKKGTQNINVHGGYFDGKFSQKVMYELAFLGFQGFLETLKPGGSISEQLNELSTECRNKYIRVVLSQRYQKTPKSSN